MELLLDNGVPYNTLSSSSRTALHYAAFSKIETVKVLLEFVTNKIDKPDALKQFIDAVDSRRQTSLHIAASFGKWQTVSVLLDNGAAIKWYEAGSGFIANPGLKFNLLGPVVRKPISLILG